MFYSFLYRYKVLYTGNITQLFEYMIEFLVLKRKVNGIQMYYTRRLLKTNVYIRQAIKKLLPEDMQYKSRFNNCLGKKIYQQHLHRNFICCAFCNNLRKSNCHSSCLQCTKGTYSDCSMLLPGILPFSGSGDVRLEEDLTPWIFRTPCTSFERLNSNAYFKNFNSFLLSTTVENYEALEGIFLGWSGKKRPCHLCAFVNMDIFIQCTNTQKNNTKEPCKNILNEIAGIYSAVHNMIRFI